MCGEEILAIARKCKHCGSMVGEIPRPIDTPPFWRGLFYSSVGLVLSTRYEIIREIGRGGMGIVGLARDKELEQDVAVKLLPPEVSADERAIRGLKQEAKLAIQLTHPNIVRLHNFEEDGPLKFIVMEYVRGRSLDKILAVKQKLSVDELLKYAGGICAGLQYAHDHGVLHRDVKPANILITSDGTPKLTDFGIAREMRDSYTRITGGPLEEGISGTPAYMSPE